MDTTRDATAVGPRPRNQVRIDSVFVREFPGVELAYRRALGRRLALGAGLEYLYPRQDVDRVIALAQRAELTVWPVGALRQIHFGAALVVAQQFVARTGLRQTAVGADVLGGWTFSLPWNLSLALDLGLRKLHTVREEPLLCTLDGVCPHATAEFMPRVAVAFAAQF